MKVFLSWSGERSRAVASALETWLPMVLQAVIPWRSGSGIEPGTRWSGEVSRALQEARVGIICLTPENLDAPWMVWEAGALSKNALVIPYLFGVQPSEIGGPLVQFQVVSATRDDTRKLVQTLNRALGNDGLSSDLVERIFDRMWPDLESEFKQIAALPPTQSTGRIEKQLASLSDQSKTVLTELIHAISAMPAVSPAVAQESVEQDTVFVVHGHNHAILEKTARFIERIGAEAIILHEQANEGRTIIEKFEIHSGTKYAVVLATADDQGAAKSDTVARPRPRQNVILELGYFLGKLGRNRVCVLYEEGTELPSDISGVVYISLDQGESWKWHLARELKTAGLRVDLNRAV